MSWLLKYFEAGSTVPHTIEKLHNREAVEQSVLIFLRLGGDDDLEITDSGAPVPDVKHTQLTPAALSLSSDARPRTRGSTSRR